MSLEFDGIIQQCVQSIRQSRQAPVAPISRSLLFLFFAFQSIALVSMHTMLDVHLPDTEKVFWCLVTSLASSCLQWFFQPFLPLAWELKYTGLIHYGLSCVVAPWLPFVLRGCASEKDQGLGCVNLFMYPTRRPCFHGSLKCFLYSQPLHQFSIMFHTNPTCKIFIIARNFFLYFSFQIISLWIYHYSLL